MGFFGPDEILSVKTDHGDGHDGLENAQQQERAGAKALLLYSSRKFVPETAEDTEETHFLEKEKEDLEQI